MEKRIIDISVDIAKDEMTQLSVKQYNAGQYIRATITENGQEVNLDGSYCVFTMDNGIDNPIVDECQILEGSNKVMILITSKMTKNKGNHNAEISFYDDNNSVTSTSNIIFNVLDSSVDQNLIENNPDFQALSATIQRVKNLNTQVNEAKANADKAEAAKTEIETIKSQVETMKSDTNTIKNEVVSTKGQIETLKNETSSLKSATQTLRNETETFRNQTETIMNDTESYKNDALASANNAQESAAEAETSSFEAKNYSDSALNSMTEVRNYKHDTDVIIDDFKQTVNNVIEEKTSGKMNRLELYPDYDSMIMIEHDSINTYDTNFFNYVAPENGFINAEVGTNGNYCDLEIWIEDHKTYKFTGKYNTTDYIPVMKGNKIKFSMTGTDVWYYIYFTMSRYNSTDTIEDKSIAQVVEEIGQKVDQTESRLFESILDIEKSLNSIGLYRDSEGFLCEKEGD